LNFINDTFTTSVNEQKRNEYRALKSFLLVKKSEIASLLDKASSRISGAQGVGNVASFNLEGKPFDVFAEKISQVLALFAGVETDVENALVSLDRVIRRAGELEEHYQRLCDMEDKDNWGWN
jgi:hypothetical protein